MAFDSDGMRISSAGFGELNCKIWCYSTDDTRAIVLAAGYFPVSLVLNVGDLIYIKNGDTAPVLAYASAISPQITTVELPNAAQPEDSITTAMLKDSCVTDEKVANGIAGTKLAPLSIPPGTLEATSVATADIELLAITDALIDTVSGAKITPGTLDVQTVDIAEKAITTELIDDGAVTATQLGTLTGWVTSARIANGAVATIDIADEAVTNAKLGATRLIQVITEDTTAATSDAFTIAGVLATDFALAMPVANGAGVGVDGTVCGAGTITVYYSGTAAASESINIFHFRNGV